MDGSNTIYGAVSSCSDSFRRLSEVGAKIKKPDWLHDVVPRLRIAETRFSTWIWSYGATAEASALSLDTKLRRTADKHALVLKILLLIKDRLQELFRLLDRPAIFIPATKIRMEKSVRAIQEGLEKLEDISSSLFPRPTVAGFEDDVNFEHNMRALFQFKFPKARKTLIEQLAAATASRRRRLNSEVHQTAQLSEEKRLEDFGESKCPFCIRPQKDTNAEVWDQHIQWHVQPYPCLSEDCSLAFQFYASFREWEDHMNTIHSNEWPRIIHTSTWFCDIEHAPQLFLSEESFEVHMSDVTLHPSAGKPSERQFASLLRRNMAKEEREDLVCPLCEQVPAMLSTRSMHLSASQAAERLVKHIGGHLLSLAPYSYSHHLPDPDILSQFEDTEAQPPSTESAIIRPGYEDSDELLARFYDLLNDETEAPLLDSEPAPQDPNVPDIEDEATSELLFSIWIKKLRDDHYDLVRRFNAQSSADKQPLRSNIEEAQVDSMDNKRFVPEALIDKLITPKAIYEELCRIPNARHALDGASLEDFSQRIFLKASKVFAILVYVEKLECIFDFIHFDFSDKQLPIASPVHGGDGLSVHSSTTHQELQVFRIWSYADASLFYDTQWKFLAPVFTDDQVFYDVYGRSPLPFTWSNRDSMKEGLFSTVREVVVESGHLNIDSPLVKHAPTIAVEELTRKSNSQNSDLHEMDVRRAINKLQDERLMKTIAVIRRNDEQYFLYPWANGGNLRETWWHLRNPNLRDRKLLFWVFREICGLSSALEHLHSIRCTHGDLKPENIVRFQSGDDWGILVISGMRFSSKRGELTVTKTNVPDNLEGTIRYGNPETMINPKSITSRQSDIWSFGCILVELAVWLLYGFDELERFSGQHTTFFSAVRNTAEIHPEVKMWIRHMKADPRCQNGTAIGDVINLIEDKLLVFDLQFRANSVTVHSILKEMLEKATSSGEYLFNEPVWHSAKGITGPREQGSLSNIPAPDNQLEDQFIFRISSQETGKEVLRPPITIPILVQEDTDVVSGEVQDRDPRSHSKSEDAAKEESLLPRSSSSSVASHLLEERIHDSAVRNIDGLEFVPTDAIDRLTTRAEVIQAFHEHNLDYTDELLSYASGEGKRTFITLVEIENLKALDALRASGFNDSHLPVEETKLSIKMGKRRVGRKALLYEIHSVHEKINDLEPKRWDAFASDHWENSSLRRFLDAQWLFLAPVFTKDEFHYRFHRKRRLPYISGTNAVQHAGFFGRVMQVRIHNAHQRALEGEEKPVMALKQFHSDKGIYGQREIDTLEMIHEIDNEYLVNPIATYQQGESLSFLLPWANGGNLREFWATKDTTGQLLDRHGDPPEITLWMLTQMYGLAKGLEVLHKMNYLHGNLKPEKILCFTGIRDHRVFKISLDVGLAKFRSAETKDRQARIPMAMGTLRYAAPECGELLSNPISLRYDIWSLGCIYLELLIWLVEGPEGLEDFSAPGKFRHFWDLKNRDYELHAVVNERIEKLSVLLRGSRTTDTETALGGLLHLIKTKLLVTIPTEEEPAHGCRATAAELRCDLADIYERAKGSRDYLIDEILWRQIIRNTVTY